MKKGSLGVVLLLVLTACGPTKPAATPSPTPTTAERKVPTTCELPDVNAAFARIIPPSKYIPTEWKPAAGTDLYEAINAGGIACTYGDQDAEVGGTILWALDQNDGQRVLRWTQKKRKLQFLWALLPLFIGKHNQIVNHRSWH